MWIDSIVEEVRREREEHAERFGFDIRAIGREFQRLEAEECAQGRTLLPVPEQSTKAEVA